MCIEKYYFLFYRLEEQKRTHSNSANIPVEPNPLALNFKLNSAYGVATDDEPYHLYETIPDIPREYEIPIKESHLQAPIQPPTHNDESRQQAHDVEGNTENSDYYVNDVQGSDGDSDYYVNDP